jgi:putative transposase
MKRSRFAEEQIIASLREQKQGEVTADVCCPYGVGSTTIFK